MSSRNFVLVLWVKCSNFTFSGLKIQWLRNSVLSSSNGTDVGDLVNAKFFISECSQRTTQVKVMKTSQQLKDSVELNYKSYICLQNWIDGIHPGHCYLKHSWNSQPSATTVLTNLIVYTGDSKRVFDSTMWVVRVLNITTRTNPSTNRSTALSEWRHTFGAPRRTSGIHKWNRYSNPPSASYEVQNYSFSSTR